eukprot:CAMPEP_0119130022 /NCGR_PEP_ID=MMETSP1310-20130426/7527_1 /TAXON_ID=464262 /ORGANISM="Genus nov. species nov., Strain RCC2339" /LENGTH=766 /DNA_ID=CAMNT_0007120489 /DNA_START=63 /DNA_END=2364 /DNA_ORIENTATION=-
MKAYLLAYNLFSCAGWAYILYLAIAELSQGGDASTVWPLVATPLTIVQTAAILEIFHALFRIVRSPVVITTIQVMSRIVVLWGFLLQSTATQNHWGMLLCVISWAIVEIVRYMFYFVALIVGDASKMPFPLFFLRYSLFMVLYPTGITGEVVCMYNALPELAVACPVFYRLTIVILALYPLGGPGMILSMWSTRQRALKSRQNKLNPRPPRPISGVSWPVTNEKTGDRSTTVTNKAIWKSAVQSKPELAQKIEKERNWRFGYAKHIVENVRACLESTESALTIAQDGLKAAQDTFQFVRDGETMTLGEAMTEGRINGSFRTAHLQGQKPKPKNVKASVPYGGSKRQSNGMPRPYYEYRNDDTELSGDALLKQLDVWAKYGTIEQSAADAIRACVENPNWLDLSNHTFVLLGATSAMGPLDFLLRHGAHIVAIDLNRDFIWTKLIEKVKNSCGSMTFPYKGDKDVEPLDSEMPKLAGSDLLNDTPLIANWLCSLKYDTPATIGNYTYLDGALHVQLSVACDAIIDRLCSAHKDTSIAFLCTPTDCHVVSESATEEMKKNYNSSPWWMKLLRGLIGGKMLAKNALKPVASKDGHQFHIVDGIVVNQGPNYGLAKRLQHWRAVVARSKGHTVASNVAPSTATKSVVHNAQFAAAYGGFHLFRPMEVMFQETSHAVMGCILVHDIRNPKSAGNANVQLDNPFELFEHGAFHGGVARCGYKVGAIGEVCAVSFYLGQYYLHLIGGVTVFAGVANWVATGSFSAAASERLDL